MSTTHSKKQLKSSLLQFKQPKECAELVWEYWFRTITHKMMSIKNITKIDICVMCLSYAVRNILHESYFGV